MNRDHDHLWVLWSTLAGRAFERCFHCRRARFLRLSEGVLNENLKTAMTSVFTRAYGASIADMISRPFLLEGLS